MGQLQDTITVMLTTGHGAEPEPVSVPARVGSVKLARMIGEGAGGVVFLGFDEVLRRNVAVKLLHRRRGAAIGAASVELVDGLRAAARVKHPNIVTIHSVTTADEMPVIVMEYVDGVSMRDLLLRTGRLDVDLGTFVMRSVVSAVAAMHEADIVHRDLKPANILFDFDGFAHVCDFGLACDFNRASFRSDAVTVGGSPLYMAPEMFDGHVSPHSDVYALGVMLFEVLSGRPPYLADSLNEIQNHHRRTPPPVEALERKGVAPELCQVVERCLNKQRYLRYKTAGHLLRAIEAAAPLHERDDALRMRLAERVAAQRGVPVATTREPAAPTAMTTFDLIARRAHEKRRRREH